MKVNLCAVVLSLCAVSLSAQSAGTPNKVDVVSTKVQAVNKINLNKADADALTHSIQGIGAKRAEAIVSYRETHGPFKSVEELAQVRGVGKKFVESNLSQLQETFAIQ